MAPKVKAKAKAKGKAAAKAAVRHRPAGGVRGGARALRGRLRRPAGRAPGEVVEDNMVDRWRRGEVAKLIEIGLGDLASPTGIIVENATYYRGACKVSGIVRGQEVSGGLLYLRLEVLGTNHEELLKFCTGSPGHIVKLHQCQRGCNQEEVAEGLLHAFEGRLKGEDYQEEGWASNLKAVVEAGEVDELSHLRARGMALGAAAGADPRGKEHPEEKEAVRQEDSEDKAKKKKKDKKEKKKSKAEEDGAASALDGSKPKQSAQKSPKELYGGTGLDPREKIRNRVTRKARRYLKKKAEKSSSSSATSSSSSSQGHGDNMEAEETLFAQGSKVRQVADGFPGSLAAQALSQMRQALLQDIGDEDKPGLLKPVASLYFKQALMKKTNGPSQREAHTLAMIIDHLVRAKPACAMDVAMQRLKSIEATASGSHWSVSQRLEILPAEVSTLSVGPELTSAQKEVHSESKALHLASLPDGRKGGKNTSKGKYDGKEDSRKTPKGDGKGKGGKGEGKKKES